MLSNQRILGFPFKIANCTVDSIVNRKNDLLEELKRHGCISLKGINWSPR